LRRTLVLITTIEQKESSQLLVLARRVAVNLLALTVKRIVLTMRRIELTALKTFLTLKNGGINNEKRAADREKNGIYN